MTITAGKKSTMNTYWSDKPPIGECLTAWKEELEYNRPDNEIDVEIIEKTIEFLTIFNELQKILPKAIESCEGSQDRGWRANKLESILDAVVDFLNKESNGLNKLAGIE